MSASQAGPRKADFVLTPEQVALAERARLAASALDADPGADAVATLRVRAVLGCSVPTRLGGQGLGWQGHAVALSALGESIGGLGFVLHRVEVAAALGSDDDRRGLAVEGIVTALAHREPGRADDEAEIATAAVETGDGWQITGRKQLVAAPEGTQRFIVTARARGRVARFRVRSDSPGLTIVPVVTRGMRACRFVTLDLDTVRVDDAALVGFWTSGREASLALMLADTAARAPLDLAAAAAATRFVAERARTKQTFGRALLKWQVVQFRLLDSLAKLELVEPLALFNAWLRDTDSVPPRLSAGAYAGLVHLAARRAVDRAFDDAQELGGGRLFDEASPMWRWYLNHLAMRAQDPSAGAVERLVADEAWPG